jgi:uncharacterized membrane protein YbhN (UPF0104 family)
MLPVSPERCFLNVVLIWRRYGLEMRPWGFFGELSHRQLEAVRRSSVLGLGLLLAAAALLAGTQAGRGKLGQAFDVVGRVHPGWLLLAGAGFAVALLCSSAAWEVGLRACGGRSSYTQVAARCAIGSLVNSAAPAHLGGAVRVGLLSRTLPGRDPVWRACGVGAAVALARTFALALLVLGAAAVGRIPLWPAPLLVVGALVGLALCARLSRRVAGRVGSLLQTFRQQARSPRRGLDLLGWIAASFVARLAATVAIVAALGIPRPLPVAVVLLAAVALAGILPLTPGNIGAGAAAATVALHGTGLGVDVALALGITFQAIETCAAIMLGVAGTAVVSAPGTRMRRWSFAMVGVGAVLVAASVGIASVDLV